MITKRKIKAEAARWWQLGYDLGNLGQTPEAIVVDNLTWWQLHAYLGGVWFGQYKRDQQGGLTDAHFDEKQEREAQERRERVLGRQELPWEAIRG